MSSTQPPHWRRQLLEARWPLEAALLLLHRVPCFGALRVGDGHPVLVLPGFTGDDESTVPLRWALRLQGHTVHGWRLGRNLGPTSRTVAGMRQRLEDLHELSGRKVSIVGWSLGGIYARLLAREQPDIVRQVITLGSPYRMAEGDRSAASPLWDRVEHLHDGDLPLSSVAEEHRPPLTVPATSVYTRDDGVVRWQLCIDETGPDAPNPRAENIEVIASHSGLGFNPAVIAALIDRLAQPEDDWRPFRRGPVSMPWYPKPVSWSPAYRVRAA